jgi:phage shock protein A
MSKPLLDLLREAVSILSGARSRDGKLPDISESLRAAVASHRALEIATAKAVQADRREAQRLARIEAEIVDLEDRAVLALQGNEQELAGKASAVLVDLEHQRNLQAGIAREARATLHHLETMFAADKLRLQKIQHGRTVAELRALAPGGFDGSALDKAEDLLGALDAEHQLNGGRAEALAYELGQAGFGASAESEAAAIMLRLQHRAGLLEAPQGTPKQHLIDHA